MSIRFKKEYGFHTYHHEDDTYIVARETTSRDSFWEVTRYRKVPRLANRPNPFEKVVVARGLRTLKEAAKAIEVETT